MREHEPVRRAFIHEAREETGLAARQVARVGALLRLVVEGAVLSFFSTTTVFGTPIDITLPELAVEAFYPADAATAPAIRQIAESGAG